MFNPYASNGGTVMGISGNDFALIASDTRLCDGDFVILSRNCPRLFKLGRGNVLGCAGFHGDVLTLTKLLENKVKTYRYDHGKDISTKALAGLLSVSLYNRRFFPFYVSNILVGLDGDRGVLYSYDPVGSYEAEGYRASGSSAAILQPFLDSTVGNKTSKYHVSRLNKETAVKLTHDIFISAAERDTQCGDGVVIYTVTKDGLSETSYPLRRD
ncbi:Proteasome subunit beta type-1-A isoform 2 [Schistosoma japonicum]|uniref:Proteasome subunit beta n=1 Tax=Schistosoma japonicum TaxID=6182 RepID=Q5DA88_SCHJA|nr:SJCHGC09410 protein [Schistosoma japonicum]KAH8852696.1 Proteasome subunit beta type-1-A [Schistosoma japonicum]TNN14907.1 Proteasome subunit beta type-1-A isoform 2 [Schistosoma japonicum]CAX75779.1 proteasome (prosome, macropain) subunit, beta type, 1 [Schistosoma japonicum]CAX75780.1 proteasome (prosome, macropain) subunit, beta type, 1 [Schistosoma japonicum]